MCSVIGKLAERFFIGTDPCGIGCPGRKLVQIIPKPEGSGSDSCVANECVLWVCDPESRWDLVCIEQRGGTAGQDAKVTDVAIVSLYSILLGMGTEILYM